MPNDKNKYKRTVTKIPKSIFKQCCPWKEMHSAKWWRTGWAIASACSTDGRTDHDAPMVSGEELRESWAMGQEWFAQFCAIINQQSSGSSETSCEIYWIACMDAGLLFYLWFDELKRILDHMGRTQRVHRVLQMVILKYKCDWKDIKVFMNTLLLSVKKQQ